MIFLTIYKGGGEVEKFTQWNLNWLVEYALNDLVTLQLGVCKKYDNLTNLIH